MAFLESESVKFSGGKENAVENDVVQFVIRPQLRFVESVARLADFFGIEIPIPGRNLEPVVFLIDNLLHVGGFALGVSDRDRKSTRLNSSHRCISYAVFC